MQIPIHLVFQPPIGSIFGRFQKISPVTVMSSDDFGLDLFVELQRMVDATRQMQLAVMLTFLQLHTWLMRRNTWGEVGA